MVWKRKALRPVHLVYVDDSGSDGGTYCVMGAAIIAESDFQIMEGWLGWAVQQFVPEDQRPSFEFHASALFNGEKPFQGISRDKALLLMKRCIDVVAAEPHGFIYGAVDTSKLRKSAYSTAQPQDVAFRLCLEGLQKYYCEVYAKEIESDPDKQQELGLLICDDTANGGLKRNLQQSYRHYRGRADPVESNRGKLSGWLHDDMYFGDSSHSVGLQVADICSYVVLRHLRGMSETEHLYKQLEPRILFGKVVPE